jgi:Ser/Thr protein kinase RdoA (MazF antagonist)
MMTKGGRAHQQLLAGLRGLAWEALRRWPVEVARVSLINHGENTVYDVWAADGARYVLRLHRPGYQATEFIRSELWWLEALRREARLRVPEAVAGRDGERLQEVTTEALPEGRRCVLFVRQPGSILGRRLSAGVVGELGALLARLHVHAASCAWPAEFARGRIDVGDCFGPGARFGDPLSVPGLEDGQRALLGEAFARASAALEAYGRGADRYGVIHADLHTHNVLRWQGALIPIDFDDCASSYHMLDLVVVHRSLSARPDAEALRRALWAGYQRVRPLGEEHREALPALMLMSYAYGLGWLNARRDLPGMGERIPRVVGICEGLARGYVGEGS